MKSPYSCPICNAKETTFFQYPLICGNCWKPISNFDTGQLQMKLMFWASIKHNKPMPGIASG